ncbi:hypothetical protein BGY98DRAFT_1099662 [Russula aff. rugulosa BPL654]|nr:hypothetical protein BGY98DRAFT_1099662 [Russula aff. rugulosa BPL654]
MGNCCGSAATVPSETLPGPPVIELRPSAPAPLQPNIKGRSSVPSSSRPLSGPHSHSSTSKHQSTHHSGWSPQDPIPRSRTRSAPQVSQTFKSSSPQDPRPRARSVVQSKRSSRSDSIPMGPEQARSGVRSQTMSYPSRRALNSTVKKVLTENPQFRILVVGKRGSGKSSLINATFRVNMSVAPGIGSDINLAFRPDDNRYLIVHEYSVLETGDAGLRTVRDFITDRTNPNRAPAERLHAIWICIPTSDAIGGSIGEGVDEILNMRRAPVVVAFTKSDLAFPLISGSERGHYQYQDQTKTRAYAQEARDVPAELVSVMPQYGALFNNLIVTTDRFMMGSGTDPSSPWSSKGATRKPRITPEPLAWSVALRASRDITIQASIEIGRSRYWRNLWSNLDFADQPLKSCVNIIHADIIEIWNLYDRQRVSSPQ